MNECQFSRTIALFTQDKFNKINNSTVCIVGLGGVGGEAAIALARTGVNNFVLCDFDTISITNINRQVVATLNTIGMYKVDVISEMILSINSDAKIIKLKNKFDENLELFNYQFDYLIDAIDDTNNKYLLIKECLKRDIKFISSMGTAKKVDIKKLEIIDINKTEYDPLAKIIRKKMRDDNLKAHFDCLSSKEEVKIPGEFLASYMPVTATSGLMIADYIIKKILEE